MASQLVEAHWREVPLHLTSHTARIDQTDLYPNCQHGHQHPYEATLMRKARKAHESNGLVWRDLNSTFFCQNCTYRLGMWHSFSSPKRAFLCHHLHIGFSQETAAASKGVLMRSHCSIPFLYLIISFYWSAALSGGVKVQHVLSGGVEMTVYACGVANLRLAFKYIERLGSE